MVGTLNGGVIGEPADACKDHLNSMHYLLLYQTSFDTFQKLNTFLNDIQSKYKSIVTT